MADVGTFGIKYITSDEDLKKALRDARDGPVIVEFTTHWYVKKFINSLSGIYNHYIALHLYMHDRECHTSTLL